MGRKAIIVLHGVGRQERFSTLNAFLKTQLKEHPGKARHVLRDMGGKPVTCIHMPEKDTDVFEYHWAHHAENVISNKEVMDWIFTVASGARKFYSDKDNMHSINDRLFRQDGEFAYMTYLLDIIGAVKFLQLLFRMTLGNLRIMRFLTHFIDKPLRSVLADSLGDVTVYTSMDTNKKYHDIREAILSEAAALFKTIMLDNTYDGIKIYSHSLGSVIAYDALGRINREMNIDPGLRDYAAKISTLITFGSPLDKIAFFFDEKLNSDEQRIRYNIITQLHGLRRKYIDDSVISNGLVSYFDHIKWTNYWAKSDPISGHLDVYSNVENIELDFSPYIKAPAWFKNHYSTNAHSLYWQFIA